MRDDDRPFRRRVVELTQRLVQIPSENPPGDTRAVATVVANELRATGFDVRLVEETPGFVSVIAEHQFSEGPTLVFNGHLDVVPLGDSRVQWRHDPWGAEEVDGRLYGRGTLDMKGPLAAAIVAASRAVAEGRRLRGKLVIAAVADEEQGGERGTGMLARKGLLHGDGAVVVEPGDGGLVLAHRGLCFVELVTRGRAAHASQPAGGVNAVEMMADALRALRSISLSHVPHPLLGGPTLAVGTTIHGGQAPNVIPDACMATIDVRTVPGMTPNGVLADLDAHLRASGFQLSERGVSARIVKWGDAAETSPGERIVEACAGAFADEFGAAPVLRGMSAYTDGGWLANISSIPTIMALGPGSIADCHIVDECVVIEELERYARIYHGVIARFLGA